MNSLDKAQELLTVLKEKERLEASVKDKNVEINNLCTELSTMMAEEDVPEINIEGIKFKPEIKQTFTLDPSLRARSWDDCPIFFDWLKNIGEDGLIRTKQSVPWNTREAFLRQYIDGDNVLPEWIHEKLHETVKFSKAAIGRLVKGE